MKRKLLLALLAFSVLLLLSGGAVAYLGGMRPRISITSELVEQIQPRMTLAEVETIIGAPPGIYTSRGDLDDWPLYYDTHFFGNENAKAWVTDKSGALIQFDASDRVTRAEYTGNPMIQPTWLGRVQVWLER